MLHPWNRCAVMAGLGALAAFSLFLAGVPASAQDAGPIIRVSNVAAGAPNTITVSGHGELKVLPDIARMTFTVTTQDQHEPRALSDNTTRMQAVMHALQEQGIAIKDIQTSNYTVQPYYTNYDGRSAPDGYAVTNSVDAIVRDTSKTGDVIGAGTAAGATVDNVGFDLSDKSGANGDALKAAAANAHAKAAAIADALGVGIGPVTTVTEQGTSPPIFQPMRLNAGMAGAASPAPPPISRQQVIISADITATFPIIGPTR